MDEETESQRTKAIARRSQLASLQRPHALHQSEVRKERDASEAFRSTEDFRTRQNKTSVHGNPTRVTSQHRETASERKKKPVSIFTYSASMKLMISIQFFLPLKETRKRCCGVALPTVQKKKEKRDEEDRLGSQNRKGLLPLYR